jgi:hypothetical protein
MDRANRPIAKATITTRKMMNMMERIITIRKNMKGLGFDV